MRVRFWGTRGSLPTPLGGDAVRRKVEALFPEGEVEQFTEHFWGLLQFWRKTESDRVKAAESDR